MTKARLQYVCQSCGYTSSKWLGRCPSCGEWNSLVEEVQSEFRAAVPVQPSVPVAVTQVATVAEPRLATGIRELDRVLGGGLVPGSLVLIGGDPGIGKSTLTLAALANISAGRVALRSTDGSLNGATAVGASANDASKNDASKNGASRGLRVLYVT